VAVQSPGFRLAEEAMIAIEVDIVRVSSLVSFGSVGVDGGDNNDRIGKVNTTLSHILHEFKKSFLTGGFVSVLMRVKESGSGGLKILSFWKQTNAP
jgi:hypothetical protein